MFYIPAFKTFILGGTCDLPFKIVSCVFKISRLEKRRLRDLLRIIEIFLQNMVTAHSLSPVRLQSEKWPNWPVRD